MDSNCQTKEGHIIHTYFYSLRAKRVKESNDERWKDMLIISRNQNVKEKSKGYRDRVRPMEDKNNVENNQL